MQHVGQIIKNINFGSAPNQPQSPLQRPPPPVPLDDAICESCNKPFQRRRTDYATFWCPACTQADRAARAEREADRLTMRHVTEWGNLCPPAFRELDRTKLPNPGKLDEVMAWKFQPKGLILHGPTDQGKSRIAWHLLEREHAAGRSVRVMKSRTAIDYAALFAQGADKAKVWIDGLCAAEIVLMDDLFKAKLTDSFEAALFAIVDTRCENALPCIVTTNGVGESLESRMSEDRGGPLIRRLREFCTPIAFPDTTRR